MEIEELPQEQEDNITETDMETSEISTQELVLSQDDKDFFIYLHNDAKTTQANFFWIFIGLFVGYIAIKGLFAHWKA